MASCFANTTHLQQSALPHCHYIWATQLKRWPHCHPASPNYRKTTPCTTHSSHTLHIEFHTESWLGYMVRQQTASQHTTYVTHITRNPRTSRHSETHQTH
jgi:hypothetical protein